MKPPMAPVSDLQVRGAVPGDLPLVLALLRAVHLPTDGVEKAFALFVVAEVNGAIVGAAGLEQHGVYGLLRSVAVDPAWRSHLVGATLVEQVLYQADLAGIRGVYLLTTTAESYFPRFGFRIVPRDAAPAELRSSVEFRDACPASATVMYRQPG